MSDRITNWLEQLDLSEFSSVFAEQQVAYDDLTELTGADLNEPGVPLAP